MRKALGAFVFLAAAMPISIASAADMPVKAPPIPYPAAYNWTGFYGGAQVGYGWATEQTTAGSPSGASFPPGTVFGPIDLTGALGGFYGGYDYQISQLVIGFDGDFSWADLNGSSTDVSTVDRDIVHHTPDMTWVSTVTGRVGWAPTNDWLLFGKGGWAWGRFEGSSNTYTPAGAFASNGSSLTTRDGWTVGAGLEYRWTQHVSAKLEYDYVKFDTANYNDRSVSAAGVVTFPARSTTTDLSMLKLGLSYRF
jgi:outer membrane immunogenic protein